MEGQTSKIRTMAQDLEQLKARAEGGKLAEKPKAIPSPPPTGDLPPAPPELQRGEKGDKPKDLGVEQIVPKATPRRKISDISPNYKQPKPETNVGTREARGEGRVLSDILKQARKKITKKQEEKTTEETQPQNGPAPSMAAEDILPIEPTPSPKPTVPAQSPARPAGGPASTAARPEGNKAGLPAGQAGPPQSKGLGGEPPLNLPTEQPSTQDSSLALQAGLPVAKLAPPVHTPKQPIMPKETPEEILGLPARHGKPGVANGPVQRKVSVPTQSKKELSGGNAVGVRKGLPSLKFAVIMGGLGILLATVLGGLYWNFFIKGGPSSDEPTVAPPPTQKTVERPKPKALLRQDYENIIEIDELSYDTLETKIDELKNVSFPAESIIHIPIKYTTLDEIRYITLKELFDTLEIKAPLGLLDKNFTLFLYIQGMDVQQECVSAGITTSSCYGPRLGLVIDMEDPDRQNSDLVNSIMAEWEKTIINAFDPVILTEYQKPEDAEFKSGTQGIFATRYINLPAGQAGLPADEEGFPISTTSIDWVYANGYLIIATSQDAAKVSIERLP